MDSRPSNLLLLLTSLLHFSQSATEQSSYIIDTVGLTIRPSSTVQSGTWVTIKCQVSVIQDNIPNLTHTFQLTRDDVIIYQSTTTEDSLVYELNPARAADSGIYECRVTVRDKSRMSPNEKLDVTGLHTPILTLNNTMFYEGDDFIATCSAPEERGSLTFRFFKRFGNEEPQRMKQIAATGNSSETRLVLRQVGEYRLYCDYEMNLVSGFRHSNHSNEARVVVRALNISPVMNVLPSTTVFEGDLLEVVCKVVNSLKNVEVFLTKGKTILKKAPVSLSHRFKAKEGDSGELTCKAELRNVQKETYQTIQVKELFSKPRLTVEPIDIFEGDTFKLTCSSSIYVPERINNETIQYSIYRDKVLLTSSGTYRAVANPNTNGNYTCKSRTSSVAYSLEKESQTLVLEAKVLVSKPVLSVVGGTLVLGKSFQLLCHSDKGTLPITYTVHGPGQMTEKRVVSRPGQQAIFTFSAISKKSDLNDFICHVRNRQQEPPLVGSVPQLLHSTKIIEPVSKLTLTIDPGNGDVSEGQDLTLTCSVQKGTPPFNFTWYNAKTNKALASESFNKQEGSYFIHNVQGVHQGGYYCVCNNPADEAKKSNTVTITVKLAGWKKGLIALFCILFILALSLVIAFKTRLPKLKRKRTGELSVKSAGTKGELLSLTQAEVNETANVTPGMMGKSVWSEHVSGSESDDQNSVNALEPQYKEIRTRPADPNRAPVKKGTDTVYSEVRSSKQGVPEQADGGSVEYVELNLDKDHHGDHSDHGDNGHPGHPGVPGDHSDPGVPSDHGDHGDHVDQGDHGDHCDHGDHGDHSVQDDHVVEIDSSADTNTADHGE